MRRSAASHKKKGVAGAARGGAQRGTARTPAAAAPAAAAAASSAAPTHSYFPANSEAAEKRRAAHRQQQQYNQQQSQHGGSRSRRQSIAAVSFGDPFASIRSRQDSKESHMIQANIVLAAIADLLKEQGFGGAEHGAPEPSATHYFGMLMVLLEQRASQTAESLGAIMYLLSVLLPQLPRAVLKSKVEATASVLISLLESHADDALLAKHVLECATTLLLATAVDQVAMWTTGAQAGHKSVTKLLQVLLVYSLDHRPRVRKAGQEGVKETLKAMYEHSIEVAQGASSSSTPARIGVPKSVSETMCNFSLREVSQCTPKDCQIVLFLCGLLQGCIQFLSLSSAARILEAILSLVGRGNSILMVQAMRTIDAFFVRASEIHLGMGKEDDDEEDEEEEERSALPSSTDPKSRDKFLQLSSQLLSVLLSLKPHHNDQLATQAYLHTLQLGLTRFMSGVEGVGSTSGNTQGQSGFVTVLQHAYEKVPELLGLIAEGLLSPKPDVVKASTKAMTNIIKQCITQGMVRASMTEAERKASMKAGAGALPPFYRVLEMMESLLGYRYKVEWNRILLLISHLFHATAAVGRDAQQLLLPILRKMDMMHNEASTESFGEDPSKDYRPALDEAMGAAIQTMGPEAILTVLPLNLPLDFYVQQQGMKDEDMDTTAPLHEQLSSSRAWLLPLFRAYLPHSPHAPLGFFLDFFFPIAQSLHELEKVALTPSPTRPSGSAVEAKAFHSLKLSIWDLLPAIASSLPSDLSTSFKRVVKQLVTSVLQVDEMSFAHANVCKGVANTIRRLKDIVGADQEAQAAQGSNKATDEDEEEAKAAFDDEEDSEEDEDEDADSDDESALAKAKAKRAAKAAQQKKAAAASTSSSSRRRSGAYTSSEAQSLLSSTISPLSKHLLPVLFNLALMPAAPGNSLAQQRREAVFDAVTLVASVSEEGLLNQTIKKVLKKLLEHTTTLTAKKQQAEAPQQPTPQEVQRTHLLMDLVGALCAQSCSHLHADSVQYLYTILKSQLTEGAQQGTAVDAGLQKKCYKILSTLLSQHTTFFKEQWKVVVQDLIAASPSLHPSALKARLGCLRPILVHAGRGILKDKATTAAILPVFLGEVMLGTKDASVRTRDEAFNVLVEVGLEMYKMQEEKRMAIGMGASVQDLFGGLSQPTSAAPVMSEYIYMVAAGLAGSSPHMQSASVLCLARMVYEFRGNKSNLEAEGLPPLDESLVVSLLQTLLPLFTSKSRELIKALLTFTKVAILTLSPSTLAQGELLEPLVAGLVSWCHEKKQRFKLKIKLLFELLMKKVGVEPVAELVPEQHAALIAHIRKTKEREKRQKTELWKAHQRKKGAAVEGEDGVSHRALQDYDSIMRDDDAEEGKGADASSSKAAQSRLRKEAANQMYIRSADVDFLDPSVITKVSASDPRRDMTTGRSIAFGAGVSQDAATGKLRIDDQKASSSADAKRAASMIDLDELEGEIKDKQREKRKRARDQMEDDEEEQGGGRAQKKQQLTPGHQFRSTKAGGDMKRRGQLNPYAFVPLDPQQMNKRKKFTAARRLESIVTAAKKGSEAGSSIAKKNHSRSHKNKVHHKKR